MIQLQGVVLGLVARSLSFSVYVCSARIGCGSLCAARRKNEKEGVAGEDLSERLPEGVHRTCDNLIAADESDYFPEEPEDKGGKTRATGVWGGGELMRGEVRLGIEEQGWSLACVCVCVRVYVCVCVVCVVVVVWLCDTACAQTHLTGGEFMCTCACACALCLRACMRIRACVGICWQW